MRKFFSPDQQIKLIKNALKKAKQGSVLYNDDELIKLKTSLNKLRDEKEQTRQLLNRGFGYDKTIES